MRDRSLLVLEIFLSLILAVMCSSVTMIIALFVIETNILSAHDSICQIWPMKWEIKILVTNYCVFTPILFFIFLKKAWK